MVRRLASDVRRAWRCAGVKRGLLGSALIFVGSLTPAYLPQNTPWWQPLRALGLDSWPASVAGTAAVVAGVILMLHSWLGLRPGSGADVKFWAVALLWSLPLLIAPPVFSHDAYGYAAEGWLLRNGLNPYDFPVSALPGSFADQAAWVWRYDTAMYPPLSLLIFAGVVVATGQDPYLSAVGMRAPAVAGVAMIGYFLPRIARRVGVDPVRAAWFTSINPLLLIDLVGGAHNDALMMGLVVWALWLAASRPKWVPRRLVRLLGKRGTLVWGLVAPSIVLGVAACVKQPAFLAAYPVALLGHSWTRLDWPQTWRSAARVLGCLAVSAAVFAGISLASGLGFGWVKAAAVPGKIVTLAPFSLVGTGLEYVVAWLTDQATGDLVYSAFRALGLVLTLAVIVWLGFGLGRRRPLAFLSWSWLAFAFCGYSMYSWYLTWGGSLLPLASPGRRAEQAAVVVTSALLAYEAGNLSWRNDAVALGMAALAIVAAMLVRHHRKPRVAMPG
ncbi:MAG: polyprenol phosphomannose-dependent alpha 1,6 mannosyltransferase MptB [Propionibacteriaceae bacterium]|nr:polyprenol phosphomannose-dependent alpha 1,6 mannosyltransferase MptB [Propionibacteriaceae bacterium]